MKERRSESLFSFRRGNNRYSLQLDRTCRKDEDVQLKRASWSSFPLLRFSSESTKELSGPQKSQSSENIKQGQQSASPALTAPRVGCGFLRSSNGSVRSGFSTSSSSSSASSSSSTSSPSMRSSGSSGKSSITSILEGSVSDSRYDSCSTVEDLPTPTAPGRPRDTTSLSRSTSDVIPFVRGSYGFRDARETSSVPLLYQGEGPASVPSSPKIIYAHKKTPDVKRKSRKQLVQELEFVRKNGSLPENLEVVQAKMDDEKENVMPRSKSQKHVAKPKSNFRFMQNYKFLSKLENKNHKKVKAGAGEKGEKIKEEEDKVDKEDGGYQERSDVPHPTDNPVDTATTSPPFISATHDTAGPYSITAFLNAEFGGLGEDYANFTRHDETYANVKSHNDTYKNFTSNDNTYANLPSHDNPYANLRGNDEIYANLQGQDDLCARVNGDTITTTNFVIDDIIEEEEDSECDLNEFLTYADESTCFERRLEDKLEMLEEEHEAEQLEQEVRSVKRTEMKIQLAKPHHKALSQVHMRSRLLRHISEEGDSGASGGEEEVERRSSPRTPSTPRSPGIDIDDVFKQKQREIEEGTKDDMTRVRDLTTRLKLATRRPSYLEWLKSLQAARDMGGGGSLKGVLETHPPCVLEEGAPEIHLTEDKRKQNLQSALGWLKKELLEMRQQDQQLARQLMQLRIELQRVRLLSSCSNHQAMVEELTNEAEEAKTFETSDLCDVPQDLREAFSPILKEIGVTRMNLTSRRFSLR